MALGGFSSRISGVRGVRGLQMKVDVKSLEVKVDQKVTMMTRRGEPRHRLP